MTDEEERLPRNFGRYVAAELAGGGTFGRVYKGFDPNFRGEDDKSGVIAIKVLAARWRADLEVRQKFFDEARLMRQLQERHHGVVRVTDIDEHTEDDGTRAPFFVMEYCVHGTLESRLQTLDRPLTLEEALGLANAIAWCVGPLHTPSDGRRPVVHRDLKPSNFLIRQVERQVHHAAGKVLPHGLELVVGDFGLAKAVTPDATHLTRAQGTREWGAPEQFDPRKAARVTAAADVYAISAIVTAAMAKVPHPAVVERRGFQAFTDDEYSAAGPLAAELRKGLSFEPSSRHQHADEWLEALFRAVPDPDLISTLPARPRPVPKRRLSQRRVLAALGTIASLVLAAVGLSVLASSNDDAGAILGPARLVADRRETAVYTVADASSSVEWIVNGQPVTSATELVFEPTCPGDATIGARYSAGTGQTVDVMRSITIDPSPNAPRLSGVRRVTVGESVTLVAERSIEGAVVRWTGPNGRTYTGDAVEFNATDPGPVLFVATQVNPDGSEPSACTVVEVVS